MALPTEDERGQRLAGLLFLSSLPALTLAQSPIFLPGWLALLALALRLKSQHRRGLGVAGYSSWANSHFVLSAVVLRNLSK